MRGGRPATSKRARSKVGVPTNQAVDKTRELRKRAKSKGRVASRSSLLKAILRDPRLSETDRRLIRKGFRDRLSVADMSAMINYQILFALSAYQRGELTAKDVVVAMNKCASQLGASVQLSGNDDNAAASIAVAFELEGLPEATGAAPRPSPGATGDLIDVEA